MTVPIKFLVKPILKGDQKTAKSLKGKETEIKFEKNFCDLSHQKIHYPETL